MSPIPVNGKEKPSTEEQSPLPWWNQPGGLRSQPTVPRNPALVSTPVSGAFLCNIDTD